LVNVSLNRISTTIATDGSLKVQFRDELHPITDEDGNPKLTGEVDANDNPVYEYAVISINVTPEDITESAIQESLNLASDKAMVRAKADAEKQETRLALKALMDTSPVDDPQTIYEGDAEAYVSSTEQTESL